MQMAPRLSVLAGLATITIVTSAAYVITMQMVEPDFNASRHVSIVKYDPALDPKVEETFPELASILRTGGGAINSSSIRVDATHVQRMTLGIMSIERSTERSISLRPRVH